MEEVGFDGDLKEFFEYVNAPIGRGRPVPGPVKPLIAVPTTAGTGAEVTRNAVIGIPEAGRKVSLRDPRLYPALALVDPELTYACPRQITADAGIDALTHAVEAYLSKESSEIAAEPADPDRAILSEYHAAGAVSGAFMLRKGRFKLNWYIGFPPELFDLQADPEELTDLAGDPAFSLRRAFSIAASTALRSRGRSVNSATTNSRPGW